MLAYSKKLNLFVKTFFIFFLIFYYFAFLKPFYFIFTLKSTEILYFSSSYRKIKNGGPGWNCRFSFRYSNFKKN